MTTSTLPLVEDPARATRDAGRWRRRALTFPVVYLGALIACALFPIALPLAFLADLVRGKRFALSRCVIFFCGYLAGEVAFISFGALQWFFAPFWTAAGRARLLRWSHFLSRSWGTYLDSGGRFVFSVGQKATGLEALEGGGPAICFLRHASIADNLLAPTYFANVAGFDLLYVAKRELQHDPIFDMIGNRIRACFVNRGSGQADREIARVVALLDDLGPKDAIIVYPEGTRFSEKKRAHVLEAIEKKGDAALTARARALRHVLPPRLGGPVALLESAVERRAGTDVIFCFHAGYEGAATFGDLVQGRAIGRTVRLHFERVPFTDLPHGREAIAEWFYARWEKLDAWIDAELPGIVQS
jgi:1-acyl-sn-glycerol-3-phosphate acyltransferase